jgi:phosphatidylserine/phosphatidylglycerophosphate/cardiolipin synthase-like enzyme
MKLSDFTIEALKNYYSGEDTITPYRSGPTLVKFFNGFGARDVYSFESGGGLPNKVSRGNYVRDKLLQFNGTKTLLEIILALVDIRFYKSTETPQIDEIMNQINKIIAHDGYQIEKLSGKYIISGSDIPDEIEIDVHFAEIELQLLNALDSAKFLIWVAVAWFTNPKLMRKLYEKTKQDVNVQLIILDDEINAKTGFRYENFFETKFYKPEGKYGNIMHNKFAIIDLKTVVHGSYNWTIKANYNKETLAIESSRDLAEKYASEFIKLKT